MARGDQLSRQWRLVQLLYGKMGRTLGQLSAELSVTKRTVQRDISDLERAGFPVVSETHDDDVRWHFVEGFRAESAVCFTLPELMALYFSKGLLRPLQGTAVHDALESAMGKIGASIPAQGHNLLKSFAGGIAVTTFGWKDYSKSTEIIQLLTKAVLHHQTVEIKHTATGHDTPLSRKVDPYRLWYVNNGLYLVGLDHYKDAMRVFAVERIETATVTNRRFEASPDFNFEEFTKSAFRVISGEPQVVRIRFSADQASFVAARVWHSSQKITYEADGSLVLELSVADLGEVKRWLIGWGAAAQVLEPKTLEDEIQSDCLRRIRNVGKKL
jgi:predicted DNA-binding transcriptional regulator YafY